MPSPTPRLALAACHSVAACLALGACPSSSGDPTPVDTEATATSSGPSSGDTTSSSSSADPSDTSAGDPSDTATSTDADASSGDATTTASDAESSGGPTNDCTNGDDPCVLALGTAHAGGGGVDQFFVYTVGDGAEQVRFDGIAQDYVAWDDAPWSFLCAVDGPCCLSSGDGPCTKPLAQAGVELPTGATAYLFVYANADYELAIE